MPRAISARPLPLPFRLRWYGAQDDPPYTMHESGEKIFSELALDRF